MAAVILGGIATSTALSMIVIPALYLKYGRATATRTKQGLIYSLAGSDLSLLAVMPVQAADTSLLDRRMTFKALDQEHTTGDRRRHRSKLPLGARSTSMRVSARTVPSAAPAAISRRSMARTRYRSLSKVRPPLRPRWFR
jgi:hypothetical protein